MDDCDRMYEPGSNGLARVLSLQHSSSLLKANGYNAIRTSHNPVSRAFVDACNRLGVLLMEEAFDCWDAGKNSDDYHLFFEDWWQRDIASMVLRDRNAPAIVFWSIGNEIPNRHVPRGAALSAALSEYIRHLDDAGGGSRRAITSAYPGVGTDAATAAFLAPLDVAGYNYSPHGFARDHVTHPARVIAATETFPESSVLNFNALQDYPWVVGTFIWTAIDYIGESSIGANGHSPPDPLACGGYCPAPWSYHISFCGDLDIVGGQKPQVRDRPAPKCPPITPRFAGGLDIVGVPAACAVERLSARDGREARRRRRGDRFVGLPRRAPELELGGAKAAHAGQPVLDALRLRPPGAQRPERERGLRQRLARDRVHGHRQGPLRARHARGDRLRRAWPSNRDPHIQNIRTSGKAAFGRRSNDDPAVTGRPQLRHR